MPIQFIREDITRVKADAIVNAANTTLLGGGGVDGAIHAAAGPELLEECRKIGGCPTGEARITGGYCLNAKYIIHTPGPVWQDGKHGEGKLLADCYRNSLKLAEEYGCESIAFPLISSGAYGFPPDEALKIAVETIGEYPGSTDMTVYLTLFGKTLFELGDRRYMGVISYVDDSYVAEHEALYDRAQNRRHRAFGNAVKNAPQSAIKQKMLSDFCTNTGVAAPSHPADACALDKEELRKLLERQDEGFSQTLLRMIDERGMTDPECYKRANMDRRHFNHIKNTPDYRPKKETVLALAVALKLNLRDTDQLLNRAGFALTDSDRRDRAMRYFIVHRLYDINQINMILFDYDMTLLG